jgi:hypothetical protein
MIEAPPLKTRVWFKSKWGDRVTGTFDGMTTMPVIEGDAMVEKPVARILSYNTHGTPTARPTPCLVPLDKLNLE